MDDIQLKLAHERVPKQTSVPFCRLGADKNFAVSTRSHVSRTRLPKKLPMQKRHSPVRDQPDKDLAQFPQIRLFPLLQLQTMPQDLCVELVESSRVDWNGSLQIANRNFRNCHSERSEESLKVAGQTKSIIRDVSLRST